MKHVIFCIDGMADFPLPALGNRTPMEAARTPHLDRLARQAAFGRAQTSFPALPCGSPVANLEILGYDPAKYHPNGRSSFEALAAGTRLRPGDISFRCNLVTISDDGRIADFTAGQIDTDVAAELVWAYEVGDAKMELYVGQSTEAAAEGTPVVIGQRMMDPFLSQARITWNAAFANEANRGEAALDQELEIAFEKVSAGVRG
jgi:2,3-bisphosphoglycerate-independent phosphoglycerate mutase